MVLTINTNISSLMVQLSLKQSSLGLDKALQQMTTGYRINSAKDDAAGYAVATKMAIDLSSYNVAQNNAMLGISLLSTASSSLDLVTTHLQRIRDLVEQAANGTYGNDSIAAIQAEIDQRIEEVNRIMETTEYNGIKLFQGNKVESNSISRLSASASISTNSLPIAANGSFINKINRLSEKEAVAQGYTVIKTADELQAIKDNPSGKYILMNDIDLSSYNWNCNFSFTGELNGNGFVIKNISVTSEIASFISANNGKILNLGLDNVRMASSGSRAAGMAYSNSGEIDNCYVTGVVSESRGGYFIGGFVGSNTGNIKNSYTSTDVSGESAGGFVGSDYGGLIVNSYSTGRVNGSLYTGGFVADCTIGSPSITNCYSTCEVICPIPFYGGGFAGSTNMSSKGISNCYYNKDTSIITSSYGGKGVSTDELNQLIANGTLAQAKPPSEIIIPSPDEGSGDQDGNTHTGSITLQIGIDSSVNSKISFDTSLDFSIDIDVSTTDSARNSLDKIDAILDLITAKQTELGAVQNRLDSVLDSLNVSIENTTSSLSTIKDADIAKVSADYIRAQILQQASASLLATANQTPSIALNLI